MPATHWDWEERGRLVMILDIKPLCATIEQSRRHFYQTLKEFNTSNSVRH